MTVIVKNKTTFNMTQYDAVSNLAYDSSTKIYTVTFGNAQTATFSSDSYLVAIMFK